MHTIHDLAAQGYSIYHIARTLGLARNTARKYLRGAPPPVVRPPRPSKLDPFKTQIQRWVTNNHLYNCETMLERLRSLGYTGSISILKDFVHPLRPARASRRPVQRYEGVAKSLVKVYDLAMNTCPTCQQTRYQVKDGFTSTGSQRMRCRACGQRYTPAPKPLGYPEDIRTQALKMYVDGRNFRRIARLLGVHHQTVINWVTAHARRVPDAPPLPSQGATVEMDELYTFVQTKKTKFTS